MRYCSVNELQRFVFRDHWWELASRGARDVTFQLDDPAILAGEFAGEQIKVAFVTFRNFRLEWAIRTEGETEITVPFEEAMAFFAGEPLFVFSYWTDRSCCEMCGLGEQDALAMLFAFDALTVEWDDFAEVPVGELVEK